MIFKQRVKSPVKRTQLSKFNTPFSKLKLFGRLQPSYQNALLEVLEKDNAFYLAKRALLAAALNEFVKSVLTRKIKQNI